jgi:glycosyltransferase involved in cell wall biosynthesis
MIQPETTISVVIPAYNAAHFLPRSLASVFAQTLPPNEVIVVDDGSTDHTSEVADALGARVIRQENRGLAAARNTGIQNASGEWIALLDADDSWLPEKLARQAALIQPEVVFVYTGTRHFDDHGTRIVQRAIEPTAARKMLRYCNPIVPSSALLRRLAVLAAGGFREGVPSCEDWGMWVRLLPFGSLAAVPEPLTNYYLHPQSISASPERMLDGLRAILEPTLLNGYHGIERWIWRRRIWAEQLCSAALIARDNHVAGEMGYIIRSLLAWPSPFWQPRRFFAFGVSLQNKLFRKGGGGFLYLAGLPTESHPLDALGSSVKLPKTSADTSFPVRKRKISVSAVIPAYNAEEFISVPIQSILEQTCQVDEIIVVDDGSTDRTAEVAAGFRNTRVIRRPNGGQGAARNTGIQAASGEWIALLDHDDAWHPEKTEIQLRYIAPDAGVIHANRFDPIHFGTLWHRQAHITPSGAMVRKQALLDVGGFEESRAVMGVEDLTLWLKIALTQWRFVRSRENLFNWRLTGKNQSVNDAKMALADLAAIDFTGNRVRCQPEEIERIRQASRVEYAKNLIAGQRWDEAIRILGECTPGRAPQWLSLACMLKTSHLARTNLVRWLHTLDAKYSSRVCSGECSLPEPQHKLCMESCRTPYFRS